MSSSKKVTTNKVAGKTVGVRGKTLVASQTTEVEPVESPVEDAAEVEDAATETDTTTDIEPIPADAPEKAPARRDPRLPEIGTPIIRKWRGHVVTIKETEDGIFKVKVDRDYIGEARSLTKAAEMALATEGITSGVNGFAWFHVGEEAKSKHAATDRRLVALTAMVARLDERIEAAEDRASKLRSDRNDALRQIDKIHAAMEAAAAAETTASED